jgi:hypothetical protein
MVGAFLFSEAILRLIEAGANILLRAVGGPDHVPQRNEDFVWY